MNIIFFVIICYVTNHFQFFMFIYSGQHGGAEFNTSQQEGSGFNTASVSAESAYSSCVYVGFLPQSKDISLTLGYV